MTKMYSLNEIGIVPAPISDIKSREEVNPFIVDKVSKRRKLPIFVSPMTCVINEDNFDTFYNSKVIPILPRGEHNLLKINEHVGNIWRAYSINEFEDAFLKNSKNTLFKTTSYALIDVANGHMKRIFEDVKKAKEIHGDKLVVMTGNIANPETYEKCCNAGIDYVRIGIGGGSACTTSVLTGIHVSHEWMLKKILLKRLFKIPKDEQTKVIVDGGIDTIDKAIKCLALGADYVMMGKQFAKCKEACGKTYKNPTGLWREYYGMASIQGQKDISGGATKSPEGIETCVKVDTTLEEFTNKFEAALRSAMSYTNCKTLKEFTSGKVETEIMTINEFNSFYK